MKLRKLAVLHLCYRLLGELESGFQHVLASVAEVDGSSGTSVPARKRNKLSTTSSSTAKPVDPDAHIWAGITSYLNGMLSAKALSDTQYAGSLEISAVAERLHRIVVVLVESDNREDVGGVYGMAGAKENTVRSALPPLIIVNNRRRHMYPVSVRGQAMPAAVMTFAGVRATVATAATEVRHQLSDAQAGPQAARSRECVAAVMAVLEKAK